MEKRTQVVELEPYQLHYSDLILLSSPSSSSSSSSSSISSTEIRRLESVTCAVMEALGPSGAGLLTITGVPNAAEHRNSLLPLARDLSLLPHLHRKRILKDHGLGSDVSLKNLGRSVSSFAMQLNYGHDLDSSKLSHLSSESVNGRNLVAANFDADENDKSMDAHFNNLACSFRKLGLCMMDLGLRVARICDRVIGGKELESSLLESRTARGRLIHYHSFLDTCIIKEAGQRKESKKGKQKSEMLKSYSNKEMHRDNDDGRAFEKSSDLWQQWHYDYGTFTVLTSPMFTRPRFCEKVREEFGANSDGLECLSLNGNTHLQIFDPKKNNVCTIKVPPESFILQVGESADILSRKKLQATLHSVARPFELENLSRETFVVFLHPAWDKIFDIPPNDEEVNDPTVEIHKVIPPLSSRLKNGMTFAEFSRETTKQYYGGNGLQSSRRD